jgi:hypothetical protein
VTIIARLPWQKIEDGSAWTLNAGEPVEEPEAHRTGDIKNHLADFSVELVLCRFHSLFFNSFRLRSRFLSNFCFSRRQVDKLRTSMLKLSAFARHRGHRDGKTL